MSNLLYETLKAIPCYNWYCGEINALYAWSNNCTIERKSDQQRIRRELKKIGYKAMFGNYILNIKRITN